MISMVHADTFSAVDDFPCAQSEPRTLIGATREPAGGCDGPTFRSCPIFDLYDVRVIIGAIFRFSLPKFVDYSREAAFAMGSIFAFCL
jgi:hypothetical protein